MSFIKYGGNSNDAGTSYVDHDLAKFAHPSNPHGVHAYSGRVRQRGKPLYECIA